METSLITTASTHRTTCVGYTAMWPNARVLPFNVGRLLKGKEEEGFKEKKRKEN
jgi:hypothetical protein